MVKKFIVPSSCFLHRNNKQNFAPFFSFSK